MSANIWHDIERDLNRLVAPNQEEIILFFNKIISTYAGQNALAFKNFYAQVRYVLSIIPCTREERAHIEAFRKWLKANPTFTNPELWKESKKILQFIIDKVQEKDVHLEDIDYFIKLLPQKSARHTLKIICTERSSLDKSAHSFTVKGYDIQDLDYEIAITFTDTPQARFTYLFNAVQKDLILYIQDVKQVKKNIYVTTNESLVILEPDFLIDATAIGECFQRDGAHQHIYLLSKLVSDLPGSSALKGSIIGYFLDELLRNEEIDNQEVFFTAQRENAMKSAQFGRNEMSLMFRSIVAEHLPNLKRLLKQLKEYNLWIEPTFFSAQYGLQGRLDVLAIHARTDAKDIIELKSGNAPKANYQIAWTNHTMQVVAYEMMLRSTYGSDRVGNNSIYYSLSQEAPRRNIVSESRERQQALQIRNLIVADIYRIAFHQYYAIDDIVQNGIDALPSFSHARLEHFQKVFPKNELYRAYYLELISFLFRELIQCKVGGLSDIQNEYSQSGMAALWLDHIGQKESAFRILYDLSITDVKEEYGYIYLRQNKVIQHAFREGDLIVLYPQINGSYEPLQQHILKGSINAITSDSIIVSLFNKQTDYSYFSNYNLWSIEPDVFERNYMTSIASLFYFITQDKKDLILGIQEPLADPLTPLANEHLTETQKECLAHAIAAKNYYLLQGPPGTGKTSTFLIEYIRHWLARKQGTLIVLAFTNKAVDRICMSLQKPMNGEAIPYLRIGNKNVEDDQLFHAQLEGDDPSGWAEIIQQSRIIVSTVTTFHSHVLLLKSFVNYSEVIIDEASQLTEADLAGILSLFKKFILIGDQNQLPSVVTQSAIFCKPYHETLIQYGIKDLRISLFERLYQNAQEKKWYHAIGQLVDHYRMHEDIAQHISRYYERALIPGTPNQSAPLTKTIRGLKRFDFIETKPDFTSKKNIHEAEKIVELIHEFIAAGIYQDTEIGVITPFRAQIALIKNLLQNENIIVDTVERYQGDERRLILFSTTIASVQQAQSMQNLSGSVDRKLLVSISRAIDQFIIFGQKDVLVQLEQYEFLSEMS